MDRRTFLARVSGASLGGAIAHAYGGGLWPIAFAQRSTPSPASRTPIIDTASGRVQGVVEAGVNVFKGIPYGASTGGANRFKAPQPVHPWTAVRDTLAYGPTAAQGTAKTPSGSEDCLVLNVWTRGPAGNGRRPVMVWLHGGGFATLSGSSAMYDGGNLCLRGDVVVVTLNHRLNVFGYLHLSDLAGSEWAAAGNAGMLDIIQALQWVRTNIERFGGDPANVTIFGESGGGRKVSTLLAMPDAKNLFHRAIIQSGPGLHLQPRDKSTEITVALFHELGLRAGDVRALQQVSMERLIAAQAAVDGRLDEDARDKGVFEQRGFVPTVGVPTLPAYAFDPVATEISADVPVLVGTNRHELAYFLRSDPKIMERTLTEDELRQRVVTMAGSATDRVLEVYKKAHPSAPPAVRWILMRSDRTYRLDSITLAQRKAAAGRGAVYMYLFAWEAPVQGGRLLAHHALEITFAFDNTTKVPGMSGGGPPAAALAAKMSEAWIAFARSGKPGTPDLPAWPAYRVPERPTMVFDNMCAVVNDPGAAERHLWFTV
jgi:para-nitrobenzyl esterase